MAISFRIPSKLSFRRSEYIQGRSRNIKNGGNLATQEFNFGDEDEAEDEISSEVIELHTQTRSRFTDSTFRKQIASKKDNVKYSIKPGDTLQSVSLKYGCPMSELKRVNNLISDQEFYALGKIKIPVKEHSLLSEILPLSPSNSGSNSGDESNPSRKTFNVSIGHMFQEDSSHQAISFLEDMDKDIQRIVKKTQKTLNVSKDHQNALSARSFQPILNTDKNNYDGANWGINWCSLIIIILILGILAPTFYGIYIVVSVHQNAMVIQNATLNT